MNGGQGLLAPSLPTTVGQLMFLKIINELVIDMRFVRLYNLMTYVDAKFLRVIKIKLLIYSNHCLLNIKSNSFIQYTDCLIQ